MNKAFSLVELSIVLVILGLLTGGILAGQNLIRASEIRSVSTSVNTYITAVHTFRDQYGALPGDMRDATRYWGAHGDAAAGACPGTPGTGTETCNGDGDGDVGTTIDGDVRNHESGAFWKQLANAGLIEGSYSGVVQGTTLKFHEIGVDVPRLKLNNAGISTRAMGRFVEASANFFPGEYGNVFYVGSQSNNFMTAGPIFIPEEAWNIDTKMDDGRPGTGRVITKEASTACHNNSDPALSEYQLQTASEECYLIFRKAY